MAFTIKDINIEVRFKLGDLSYEKMSDPVMDRLISDEVDKYSLEDTDLCMVTYRSILSVLRYLIIAQDFEYGDTAPETRRREKNNKREIEVEYSEVSSSGYNKVLKNFISHPELICPSLVDLLSSQGNVLIGGVSQGEYNRVNGIPDSRNGYQVSVAKQFDIDTAERIRRRKDFLNR